MTALLRTPLYDLHVALGAKMGPFAGWDMPIQYSGIIDEHLHTRSQAGLFDISHMGEFFLEGPGAAEALSKVLTHNIATLKVGRCRYGFLLNEKGGVEDDLIVYRCGDDWFMIVVNAGCRAKDFQLLKERLPADLKLTDPSDEIAKIDLQGPESVAVLETVLPGHWRRLPYFGFVNVDYEGEPLMVSRTGYTGELGFELYVGAAKAESLWKRLIADSRVKPVGLGARDTLRLEVGLPLYGQDLDAGHTPAEAGYTAMLTSEAPYVGKEHAHDVREKLIALSLPGRKSARHGNIIALPSGKEVGVVTSGSYGPSVEHAIAIGYVKADESEAGEYIIKTGKSDLTATQVKLPFYTKGTARQAIL